MKTRTTKYPLWFLMLALSCSAQPLAAPDTFQQSKKMTLKPATTLRDDVPITQEIEMFAGETRVIPEPNVARLAVGNGGALSAAVLDNKEILLIANAPGTTALHIWHKKGTTKRVKINVMPSDTDRVTREIGAFLANIPNTRVSTIGANVVVEGEQLSDFDIAKIDALKERYPQILNFSNRIGWEKMVVMEVKVCEFPVTELREMGMRWNAVGGIATGAIWKPVSKGGGYALKSAFEGPLQSATGSSTVLYPSSPTAGIGVNLGLDAELKMMVQNGKAAMLAEPILSARNGTKATFLAGGEIPYAVQSLLGQSVVYKEYGVKLNIEPKVDSTGVIRAKIDSEVSSIDNQVTSMGAPALMTRKTTTEFNVKDGETIVLSGFLSRDINTNVDKIPMLGDLPVLGNLFKSKRFQNRETELVVFVTPHLMDSSTPELAERVKLAEERLNNQPRAIPAEPKSNLKKTETINRPAWGQAIP